MTTFEKILIGITISCSSVLILLNVYDVLQKPSVEAVINADSKIIITTTAQSETIVTTTTATKTTNTTKATTKISTKININTATKAQLMELNGIGEVYAQRIIDYRNNKKFEDIAELLNIKGIGPKTFDKIKDNVTI